jgi:Mg2+ and Co2+ transporter CorA
MKLKHPDNNPPVPMSSIPYASATFQSATLLHKEYGQTLISEIMQCDAFYALSELIYFSASSTCQLLNLIEMQINNQERPITSQMQNRFDNLQYFKTVLEDLRDNVENLIRFINGRGTPKWPRATALSHTEIVNRTAEALLDDYRHIDNRIKRLSKRCSAGMTRIMNTALLDESRRAVDQADGVARLTLLAFFFIPLSFTASFFGMNFKELGSSNQDLSVWVWFIVSVPIFGVSVLLCFWSKVYVWLSRVFRPAHSKA